MFFSVGSRFQVPGAGFGSKVRVRFRFQVRGWSRYSKLEPLQ